MVLGIMGIGAGVLMMFVGLRRTDAEHAAVITGVQPLIAALLTWFFGGKRLAPGRLSALGLALTGVVLVICRGSPGALVETGNLHGDLLVLGAATCRVGQTLGAATLPSWSALRHTALTATAGSCFVFLATGIAAWVGAAVSPRFRPDGVSCLADRFHDIWHGVAGHSLPECRYPPGWRAWCRVY